MVKKFCTIADSDTLLYPRIRVFERYQQRFLTIGLPALLKIPTKYNLQVSQYYIGLNRV